MKNILIFFLIITIKSQAQVIPIAFIKSSTIPFPYPTVTIGNQVWMANNLDVTNYQNVTNDVIDENPSNWDNRTYGAWVYPNNSSGNNGTYGKLYNWFAVNDSRKICPVGSQVPNNDDWNALKTRFNSNPGDISSFGFDKSGTRNNNTGAFFDFNSKGYYWSADQYSSTLANNFTTTGGNITISATGQDKNYGMSVRCIVK